MCCLIEKRAMDQLWSPGMPGLKLKIYQLNEIICSQLPRLHRHMANVGLMPDFFASKWFLTLHTYTLPLQLVMIVWDAFVLDGWKAIFRSGLALLKQQQDVLLELDMGEIAMLFNKKIGMPQSPTKKQRRRTSRNDNNTKKQCNQDNDVSFNQYINCYSQRIKVTRSMLFRAERSYKENRLFEMIRWRRKGNTKTKTKENDNSSSWSMQIYEDPKASSALGPSAVAMVQQEYLALEEDINRITKNLMVRIDGIETALLSTSSELRFIKNEHVLLFADLQDTKERKGLLMSQFEFFSKEADQAIIIPMLRNKIETATKSIEESLLRLQTCTARETMLDEKLTVLKRHKIKCQKQLLNRIHDSDEKRGCLAIKVFDTFKLK